MRRPWRIALFLALAAVGLVAIHEWAPQGLYTFGGHGHALNDGIRVVLWLLFGTHAGLLGIMWTQRRKWDNAEASMFRFIGIKALFWIHTAITMQRRNGITLSTSYLAVLILLSTIDLDFQLVRRYVVRRRERA